MANTPFDTEPGRIAVDSSVRRVHPIVKIDYAVRVVSQLSVGAVMLSVLTEQPTPGAVWAALAFTSLLWPQLG